jgi:hypothetical protein
VFYVANQGEGYGGVHVIDPRAMKQLRACANRRVAYVSRGS